MRDDVLLPRIATVTSKMQLTIPAAFAQKHGIKPGDKVSLTVRNGRIVVRPLRSIIEELAGSLKEATSL
jgi:AbrB family looped-hinge helix DNA binding protein